MENTTFEDLARNSVHDTSCFDRAHKLIEAQHLAVGTGAVVGVLQGNHDARYKPDIEFYAQITDPAILELLAIRNTTHMNDCLSEEDSETLERLSQEPTVIAFLKEEKERRRYA